MRYRALTGQVILSLIVIGLILSQIIFGTSILGNLHSQFIRYKSKDVVTLINENGGGGTGFAIKGMSGKTYILTNRHICRSSKSGFLKAIYGKDTFIVKVIKESESNDLCIVEAPDSVRTGLRLARSVKLGERAYAVGHPLLEAITVTEGELSSYMSIPMQIGENVTPDECKPPYNRIIDVSDNPFALIAGVWNVCIEDIQCNSSTIPILPGNSGSPVFNIWGNVIGVVFAATESGVHSYIVPLVVVMEFLEDK